MNLSDNFKKFMGMVEQNAQQLKKDLTPTPLPSGPEVWKAGEENKKKMQQDIMRNRGAEMATDLLPAGGAVGMVKKVVHLDDYVKELYQNKIDATEYSDLFRKLHKQAFQGYEAGQHSFSQADEIFEKLQEKYADTLRTLYKKGISSLGVGGAAVLATSSEEAEAGDIRQILGVQPHSGLSMQSSVALRQLDDDMAGKKKEIKPTIPDDKGLSQKEEFKKVFGEEAAIKKKKQQEAEFKRLMQERQE